MQTQIEETPVGLPIRVIIFNIYPAKQVRGGLEIPNSQISNKTFWRARNGMSLLWIAELDGVGMIGQVFIQLTCERPELADGSERAYLYSFRIKPLFRGMGIGSAMLKFVEKDLANRGFQAVTLIVAKDNPRAVELYQRHQYAVTASEPGIWSYIDDQGFCQEVVDPAWRMEKKLPPA